MKITPQQVFMLNALVNQLKEAPVVAEEAGVEYIKELGNVSTNHYPFALGYLQGITKTIARELENIIEGIHKG